MRLLVSGFPPFPGRPENPSQGLVELVQAGGLVLPEVSVSAELLPVEYVGVEREFLRCLSVHHPDLWLAFGVGRQSIPLQLESTGRNLDDSYLPDNAGEIRTEKAIFPEEAQELYSSHDLSALQLLLVSRGLQTAISHNAGSYICNHLQYFALRHLSQSSEKCKFLFTHLAPLEMGLPLEKLGLALQIMTGWFQNREVEQLPDASRLA